jgi:hypothetical protein
MIEIIKTKGFRFFVNRLKDKIFEKIKIYFNIKKAKKNMTYISIYRISDVANNLYDSEKIHYDLLNKSKIKEFADTILLHKFNLLGSGLQEVSYSSEYPGFEGINYSRDLVINDIKPEKLISENNLKYSQKISYLLPLDYELIDWQRDFKSGFRWDSKAYYKDIRYGNNQGVDIKIPWELGRLGHLIILFYAWKISKDIKYKNEFRNQILDFIAFNPPSFGVQWSMPMDIALRSTNICVAMSLFSSSNEYFDEEFFLTLNNYLYNHLIHILNNLEWSSGMRANHYYANIIGLIYLSAYLPVNKETAFAFHFAVNELINETMYQFNSDGGNFEASVPYHNFASEMLFHTYLMLNNLSVAKISELKNMFNQEISNNFDLHNDIKNNLTINNIEEIITNKGIIFPQKFIDRIKNIAEFCINTITTSGKEFNIGDNDDGYFFRFIPKFRNDFSIISSDRSELKKISEFILKSNKINEGKYYKDFGIYLYHNDFYEIAVRCGSLGQNGKGGHAHNDQLSFELYSGSELLICDAGTYNYTASSTMRNRFRSTKVHNTLNIFEQEQNIFPAGNGGNLFWLPDTCNAEVHFSTNNSFKGTHYGYTKPHSRELNFEEKCIIAKDICNYEGHKYINFNLVPETEIISKNENSIKLKIGSVNFEIITNLGKIGISTYEYSPQYGVKYSAKQIVIEFAESEIFWKLNIL